MVRLAENLDVTSVHEKIAHRVIVRRGLSPPISVESLVAEYVRVLYMKIPVPIDGITINLKIPGRQTTVIVQETLGKARRRFTLAHELGHILIPWHVGRIVVDQTIADEDFEVDDQMFMEQEANEFAAELLMPTPWMAEIARNAETPLRATLDAAAAAKVSTEASARTILKALGPGHVAAITDNTGRVTWSNRSRGTVRARPGYGELLEISDRFHAVTHEECGISAGRRLHFLAYADSLPIPETRIEGDWRSALTDILTDLGYTDDLFRKKWSSILAIIAFTRGTRREIAKTHEEIYAAVLERLSVEKQYQDLIGHRRFRDFVIKRVKDFELK